MKKNERRISEYIDELNEERTPKEHEKYRLKNSAQEDKKKDGWNAAEEQIQEYDALTQTVRRLKSLKEPVMPQEEFEERLIACVKGEAPKSWKQVRYLSAGDSRRRPGVIKRAALGVTVVAAAAVLIFAIPRIHIPQGNVDIVYAMEQAFKELKAYHGIIEVTQTNQTGEVTLQSRREVWADQKGRYYLKELEGYGEGIITVNNASKEWQLRPEEKKVYLTAAFPDPYRFTFELGKEINDVNRALSVTETGEEKVSGRDAVILEVTPEGGDIYYLWIDKETKLPLRRQSAMQNAIQTTISYTEIEFMDQIPADLLAYELPEGYEAVEENPEQIVATLEEASAITGFEALEPKEIPDSFRLQGIGVVTDSNYIKLNYSSTDGTNSVVISEAKASEEFTPDSDAMLGSVNQQKAEFQNQYQGISGVTAIRWQEGGLEYLVYGDVSMDMLTGFAEGISGGEVTLPEEQEKAVKPQIEVPYDLTVEENEQKSVDAGHSPWKLDPVFVAQVYASLLLEPEGIVGDYPISYDAITILSNDGKEAVVQVNDSKTLADKIYLKRLVRQDDTGIWTVVGYDPAK
jgi:outer membrane lipoprotein-sorting protein